MAMAKHIIMSEGQEARTLLMAADLVPDAMAPCSALRSETKGKSVNACGSPRQTVYSLAFDAFLIVLQDYIQAERDLEEIGFDMDPAYAAWHRDAEAAQDRLIDILLVLRNLPTEIGADLPLQQMALTVHAMRCEPADARRLYADAENCFGWTLVTAQVDPNARHRDLLLRQARLLIRDLGSGPIDFRIGA